MTTPLRYRGISYDPRQHERLSDLPVEHIYRGHHYSSAPRHLAAASRSAAELHYRGVTYQHQQSQA